MISRSSRTGLALAVLCWGYSFYSGCKAVDRGLLVTELNYDQLQVLTGQDRLVGMDPHKAAVANPILQEGIDK